MRSHLFTLSLVLAWMLSPESLVLFGQNIGHGGALMPLALAGAFILSLAAASLIGRSVAMGSEGGSLHMMIREVGVIPVLALTLASRVSLLLVGATGMLVTAGFAFNEIFVHWFPNFAFAAALLVLVAVLNLLSECWGQRAQLFFMALVVGGLVLLSLSGLIAGGSGSLEVNTFVETTSFPLFSTFLLFLGFDFAFFGAVAGRRVAQSALMVAAIVFMLWGIVSYSLVPLSRLSESTLPHLLVARHAGQGWGQYVMGVVVIAGACGAVNALLLVLRYSLVQLSDLKLFPPIESGFLSRGVISVTFAVIVLVLMFTGLAGEEVLEVYVRGALLLWLLHVVAQCFSATSTLEKLTGRRVVQGYIVSMLFLVVLLSLFFSGEHFGVLFLFCLTFLSSATAFAFAWGAYNKKIIQ